MRTLRLSFVLASLCVAGGCAMESAPLSTVAQVDLNRYAGKWYEIAKYPNFFQAQCVGATTAEYRLLDNGRVEVVNRCRTGSLAGPEDVIVGSARVVDSETNAKLAVGFFGPFEGPYWVIDLDPDYQWAVVSEPARSNLWILSRTPALNAETYAAILERLESQQFDTSRLVLTPQPAAP